MNIDDILDGLNDNQKEAVNNDGNCAIISIPGSGKTTILARKIIRILREDPNHSVAAVTFSRKSAGELRHRVEAMLGKIHENKLMIKTFNAMGKWQCDRNRIKLKPIIQDWRLKKMVTEYFESIGEETSQQSVEEAIQAIGIIKTSREARTGNLDELPFTKPQIDAFIMYQQRLQSSGNNDFTDQILLPYLGMENGTVKNIPYTHLLVDEFQDSDPLQVDWVIKHSQSGIITTVVGDDDQSIFGFRGASGFNAFQDFIDSAPNVKMITLNTNYRSHSEILGHSEKLIKNNENRIDKNFNANKGGGGVVTAISGNTTYEVIEEIAELIFDTPDDETWCIITRTNEQINDVVAVFDELGIEYQAAGKFNPLDITEVSVYLSMAKNIEKDPGKTVHDLLAYYNIREEHIETYRKDYFDNDFNNLFSSGQSAKNLPESHLSNKRLEQATEFIGRLVDVSRYLKVKHYPPVLGLLKEIIESHPNFKNDKTGQVLTNTHRKLLKYAGSIGAKINSLTMANEKLKSNQNDIMQRIVLMTAHSSKGLEFDNVVVLNAEENKFPQKPRENTSNEAAYYEEERRLFFVSMTRARKKLYLAHALYSISPSIAYSDYTTFRAMDLLKPEHKNGKSEIELSVENRSGDQVLKKYEFFTVTPSRFLTQSGVKPKLMADQSD